MKKLLVMVVVISLCLVGAQAASASRPSEGARSTVAHTTAGDLRSRITGSTAAGRDVTGSFMPLDVVKRGERVLVRGLVQGAVHQQGGQRTTFAQMKTFKVASVNGTPVHGRQAAGLLDCDVLRLVLGPLDLDLLGLQVHLDRVVLTIIAAAGAGNLLGNLLCAVAGLLDGGLAGLLGRLVGLLDRILAILRLG